jgi:cytochrome c5
MRRILKIGRMVTFLEMCRRLAPCPLIALFVVPTMSPMQASGEERGGQQVVEMVCADCHATGKDGAPKIGDKGAWSDRASQGLSSLTVHALEGIRNMPAHGGDPSLSDLEISRAITYMVNQSGGNWVEPASSEGLASQRSGEQVVKSQCAECHAEGVGGAPKIGDLDAWVQRMKNGLSYLVSSAIRGHGGMPPRGGQADLTDDEIRSAILYMYNPAGATGKP